MSVDDLLSIRDKVTELLSARIPHERRELELRLSKLRAINVEHGESEVSPMPRSKRKYPKVNPKYMNPDDPNETWSGRGHLPRWMKEAIKRGRVREEFAIQSSERKHPKSAKERIKGKGRRPARAR
jgi:DNA-binding protein H-NS